MSSSRQTYGWSPNPSGISWWKDRGTYRKEVVGPCLSREDGLFYIRRQNKNPFSFGHGLEYDWGRFEPPTFDENGEPVFPGQFSKTSSAQEENWNRCWQNPVVNEADPDNQHTPNTTPTPTDTGWIFDFDTFTNSKNTTRNLIIAAVAIVVITLVTVATVK